MKNKAQAWGIDLMIAAVIFLMGLMVFYIYSFNNPREAEETMDNLFYDGKIISDSILSEGYPKNWNETDAVTIGILSDNKINETKLERFYNMTKTSEDYNKTKRLFNTRYDYYFFLDRDMEINGGIEGIGKPGASKDITPSVVKNLIKITRFVVYKDKTNTAYIYVWKG